MKKLVILFISLMYFSNNIYSKNYIIDFKGIGVSSNIDSVQVYNQTQNTNLTVIGGNKLILTNAPKINSVIFKDESDINIYPNPAINSTSIEITSSKKENIRIQIIDMNGSIISQYSQNFDVGIHKFQIANLRRGIYIIDIVKDGCVYRKKVKSISSLDNPTTIKYINSISNYGNVKFKSVSIEQQMLYNEGERLFFRGYSNSNSHTIVDVPISDRTVVFDFISCKDGDNNNYGTVLIGTQLWMTENLKTTKYNDGEKIPNIKDSFSWSNLKTGAYCWYSNEESKYYSPYGALYNWYAVDTKKLCPLGWHVPSDEEWNTLESYIGMCQQEIAKEDVNNRGTGFGNKLKETGPYGLNIILGSFGRFGILWCDYGQAETIFWLSDDIEFQGYVFGRFRKFDSTDFIYRSAYEKSSGYSVRCIKD